jgi:SWIM zinc finger
MWAWSEGVTLQHKPLLIDKEIEVDEEKDGVDSVSGYSCSCPNGLRTVGCCAHIATVLWYLGYARHLSEIPIPAAFLNNVCEELGGQEQE